MDFRMFIGHLILSFALVRPVLSQDIFCPSVNDQVGSIYQAGSVIPINNPLTENEHNNVSKFTEVITIPVVVHNVYYVPNSYKGRHEELEGYISDQIISEQLKVLNRDFSGQNPNRSNLDIFPLFKIYAGIDAGIRFELVETKRVPTETELFDFIEDEYKYQGNEKRNIKLERDGGSKYVSGKFNIWVGKIAAPEVTLPGYSSFPKWPVAYDGVVINITCFGTKECNNLANVPEKDGGQTLTHETGHYLGLYHTFGSKCSRVSENCCDSDDFVLDTPLHKKISFNCETFGEHSCDIKQPIMFMNFMNYNKDNCLSSFSKGQIERMRLQFMPGYYRHSLFQNRVINNPGQNLATNFVPVIREIRQDSDKLWISFSPVEKFSGLKGHLIRVKDVAANEEKSVFAAYEEVDLNVLDASSQKITPLLKNSIKVNSLSGLTAAIVDGIKPSTSYLFETYSVLANNVLSDKTQYFYISKNYKNGSNVGKLEVVVPR